jgi:hypothetical protein
MSTQSISNEAISEKVKEEAGPRKGSEASSFNLKPLRSLLLRKLSRKLLLRWRVLGQSPPRMLLVSKVGNRKRWEVKDSQQTVSRLRFNRHLRRIW